MTIETDKVVSLKRLVGAVKAPKAGETLALALIYGTIVSVKRGNGDKGSWTRYDGDFIGRGLVNAGKEEIPRTLQATSLFAPMADDMLETDGVDQDGVFTNVGLKISMVADAKGRVSYTAEYVLKPTQTSPAKALVSTEAPEWLGEAKAAAQTPAKAKGK